MVQVGVDLFSDIRQRSGMSDRWYYDLKTQAQCLGLSSACTAETISVSPKTLDPLRAMWYCKKGAMMGVLLFGCRMMKQ